MNSIILLWFSGTMADLCMRTLLCATVVSLAALITARLIFKLAAPSRHDVLLCGLIGIICSPAIVCAERWLSPPRIEVPVIPRVISANGHSSLHRTVTDVTKPRIPIPPDVVFPNLPAPQGRNWWTIISLIWVAGSVAAAGRLVWKIWAAVRIRQSAKAVPFPQHFEALSQRDTTTRRWSRIPVLGHSPLVVSPISLGFFRPLVLIPEQLPSSLTAQQLRAVLAHELAHIIRGDHWVGLLQELVAIVFWPHPLVHMLSRELSRAREDVCDNHALAAGGAADYARALVTVAECAAGRRSPQGALAIGLLSDLRRSSRKTLEYRVLGLLDQKRKIMKRSNRLAVAVSAVLMCTAGMTLQLPAVSGATEAAPRPVPASQSTAPQAIKQMQTAINEVGGKFDQEKLAGIFDRFTAPDFTLVGPDGLADKDAFLALVRWQNPDDVTTGLTVDDTNVRMLGDTAVETGRYVLRSTTPHAKVEARRYTAVWARRDSKWLIVHFQVSEPGQVAIDTGKAKGEN